MSCDSAKGMFDKLCSIYERDSSHNKSSLLQNFFNYKIGKVASGLSDLQNLSMKLRSVGHTVDDKKMMEEERCQTSSTYNVAFKTINKIVSFTCNKRGHIAQNCMKKQLGCKICKKDNLTEQNCYFRDRDNKSTTSNIDKVAFLTESMGLTRNLILIHKVTENGGVVKFTNNGVEVLKGRTKITGKKDNAGLYNVNSNCSETTLPSESKQTSDLNLWHRRSGHLNVDSMKNLATFSSGLEKLKFGTSDIHCETCLSKQTRKYFGKARERATRPLEIVH
ncbi:hypothetical protein PR048_011175 [Dryococelus australis]|uniref:GAG-pre-integrase domain-containing protein n=1 Tax=Dryococelus australis TaxID=614101 RepID=A0ABQ9HLE3_9NEOP|nr:hypothetical protein PR048_011175 [Dryococelus australis]